MYDNDFIADQFSLLSKLMDIHGENSFKIKSYSIAAFTIEKLPEPIASLPLEKMTGIKGIGEAIGKKILEIVQTGELPLLRKYIDNTPPGILQMLSIKGIGPKKIATIWKEMEIETIGELLYACQENRLLLYKGFGQKTQDSVQAAIEFYLKSQGSYLYADAEPSATTLQAQLNKQFPKEHTQLTGEFRRQLDTIDQLQWVTTASPEALSDFMSENNFEPANPGSGPNAIAAALPPETTATHYRGPEGILLEFIHTSANQFPAVLLATSCSPEFLKDWQTAAQWPAGKLPATPQGPTQSENKAQPDEALFTAAKINFIPPFLREDPAIITKATAAPLPQYIQPGDMRGIIHSHSNWSDGASTLEQMAKACIDKGFEYLVISDHSKTAFYANGLKEDRVKEQHQLIDQLNKQLAPFTIYKSIESDILNDGALDYSDEILSTFDLVIASVHSNLKMTEEKAMLRLLKAIENPYTTILGHMTGRLLLSRPGYPVDHKKIVDACAANQVVIELNAHPRRLDIDWRWIPYALERGVLISIDPDAHFIEGYDDIKYGALAAQKGGLTRAQNLSSFTRDELKTWLANRRKAKGI